MPPYPNIQLLILLLLCSTIMLHAQDSIDDWSGKNLSNKERGDLALLNLKYNEADSLYDLALKKEVTAIDKIKLLLQKNEILIQTGKTRFISFNLKKIEHLLDKTDDPDLLYEYHYQYSIYYQRTNNFISELEHLLQAKKYIKEDDDFKIIEINHLTSIIYYCLKDYKSALAIFEENLAYNESKQMHDKALLSYYGIADCHLNMGHTKEAKRITQHILAFSEETGASNSIGYAYSLMSSILIKESKLDSALVFANQGIEISLLQKDNKEVAENYFNKAQIFFIREQYKDAIKWAVMADEIRDYYDFNLNELLANSYAAIGDHQQAFRIMSEMREEQIKKEENSQSFRTASELLRVNFEREQQVQGFLTQQKLQNLQMAYGIFAIVGILLIAIPFIAVQYANKKELDEYYQELVEKNEDLSYFAYICSHDLKESVRNIGSFTGLIEHKIQREAPGVDYKDYFNIIDSGVSTLSKIIDSLKMFAEANRSEANEYRHILLKDVVENALFNMRDIIGSKEVEIEIEDRIQTAVNTSEYAMYHIIYNVVKNAVHHNMETHPKITIELTKDLDWNTISIQDNGPGISKDHLEYIFKPFKTLKNKSISNSSGLGLSICKKLINNLNGNIWATSQKGQGSTFFIRIPR